MRATVDDAIIVWRHDGAAVVYVSDVDDEVRPTHFAFAIFVHGQQRQIDLLLTLVVNARGVARRSGTAGNRDGSGS